MTIRRVFLFFVALAMSIAAAPSRADIEMITLRYRSADQVIPILQPMVEPGGALTGMQNQLVIRASAGNIAELRRVLAMIDTMPRRLMITVRQGGDAASADRGGSVSGSISSSGGAAIQGRAFDTQRESEGRVTQNIQVLEGTVAVIQAGQSQPVTNRVVTRRPDGSVVVTDATGFRDVTTGFSVLPRVSGDRVTLEINPQRDTPGPGGSVNVQRASSVVSGRLGEWIEIGGMAQSEARSSSGMLSRSDSTRSDNRSIWVRVEELR